MALCNYVRTNNRLCKNYCLHGNDQCRIHNPYFHVRQQRNIMLRLITLYLVLFGSYMLLITQFSNESTLTTLVPVSTNASTLAKCKSHQTPAPIVAEKDWIELLITQFNTLFNQTPAPIVEEKNWIELLVTQFNMMFNC
uniref:Uncharacterized protein n=1 Tax=viral metagenome TaxID=1070528 RepID=A0A6C0H6S9_9ZZZZ